MVTMGAVRQNGGVGDGDGREGGALRGCRPYALGWAFSLNDTGGTRAGLQQGHKMGFWGGVGGWFWVSGRGGVPWFKGSAMSASANVLCSPSCWCRC